MSNKDLKYDDYEAYFSGQMSDSDKHAFEKKSMQDVFDSDAYDGISSAKNALFLDADIKSLRNSLDDKIKPKRFPFWMNYAAGIFIIMSISLLFFIENKYSDNKQIAQQAVIADIITTTQKESVFTYDSIHTFSSAIAFSVNKTEKDKITPTKKIIEQPLTTDYIDDDLIIETEMLETEYEEESYSEAIINTDNKDILGTPKMPSSKGIARSVAVANKPNAISAKRNIADHSETKNVYFADNKKAFCLLYPNIRDFKSAIIKSVNYDLLSEYKDYNIIKFSFRVSEDGKLDSFVFVKSPNIIFENEIKRTVLSLGKWMPKAKGGHKIESIVKLRIKIIL